MLQHSPTTLTNNFGFTAAPSEMPRRDIGQGSGVYITTYGCQMNDHDTERMLSLLEYANFNIVQAPEQADLIIINTCSVREKPVHKVLSEIGTYRPLKELNPKLKIGVGGCVGQMEGKGLLKKAPLLDFVFGTDTIDDLPNIVDEVRQTRERKVFNQWRHKDAYTIETMIRQSPVSAFVSITKGCDNFCTFCVVPFTRGREKSRLLSELITDIKALVARGVKEVHLLGQNVNSYSSPDGAGDFGDLLRAVCNETEAERVRFTTSHPKDVDERLMRILVDNKSKLGTYLHLPVQSGNSRILELMNRGYTREEYLTKVMRFKELLPEVSLSTDIIVGFPGETETEFEDTLSLMREVNFESVFAFKYSPRPFTKASKMEEQITEEEKDRRLNKLFDVHYEIGVEYCKRYQDKIFDILVEGPSRQNPQILKGRTMSNKLVNLVGSPEVIGKTVPVRITQAFPNSLRGEIVQ